MKFYYITFRSVTFAQRAEKVLSHKDVICSLQRTPRWMEEQGCGYALRLWVKEPSAAVELLREQGIPMKRLYVQREGGNLEELAL